MNNQAVAVLTSHSASLSRDFGESMGLGVESAIESTNSTTLQADIERVRLWWEVRVPTLAIRSGLKPVPSLFAHDRNNPGNDQNHDQHHP